MAADNETPAVRGPISSENIGWESWAEGTRFGSRARHLTTAAVGQNYHVGVLIEELSPGMQSCLAHYHMLEEEHALILEGQLTVRLGDQSFEMKAGDYICFPAGQKEGHCFVNNSNAVCRFLMIGENNKNEVSVHTDSNKINVRALGRGHIYDKAQTRAYWDGEKTS